MPQLFDIDELLRRVDDQHGSGDDGEHKVTFLPEPAPRARRYLVISADDHLVEPPDTFEGRVPSRFEAEAPRIVENERGRQYWAFDGNLYPNIGFDAVAGRPPEEYTAAATRYDEMRAGCWDVDARVADMDLNGVYASLNFPSFLPGFAGQRFSRVDDEQLGLATLRAWNDWHIESWVGSHPDRLIGNQIVWLRQPDVAARDVRRNAERGFRSASFPENPGLLGFPSLYSDHWDPIFAACEETQTVLSIHVGSSSTTLNTSEDAPVEVGAALFEVHAVFTALDWIFSKIPVRFPGLRIALSEGGIGWVPMLVDRLEHNRRHHGSYHHTWDGIDLTPSEVLTRNFWFCALDEPSAFALRGTIGVENILIESDYPHTDSTWPDTQRLLGDQLADLSEADVRAITHENAARLYRHPLDGASTWAQQGPA